MADTQNNLLLKVGLTFSQTEAMKDFNKQFQIFQSRLGEVDLAKTMGFKDVPKEAKKATEALTGFAKYKDLLLKKMSSQILNMASMAMITAPLLLLTATLRGSIQVVSELDKEYTNFAIVTGATTAEIKAMDAEASKLTATLGRLKKEVINSITEFSRAGYETADAITLAEQAIIGANVGFTDLASVTKFLIAGLKSFNLEAEDSTRIIDTLFQVSNKTAIDFEGIGQAFLRSANTLKVAGASLEQSTALIAGANESIQDPAKVGTALKTIAARLRGVGDEGEAIPTLARDFKAVGIEIQKADGSFRNIYDIFKDFAGVYGTLDDLTKQSLVEKIAGKRQANIFIGMIENFDVVEMALTEGMNSIGQSAKANEKYLESIEGRITLLKESVNKLFETIMSSEALKLAITLLTNIIKLLTGLAELLPEISIMVGVLLGAKGFIGLASAFSLVAFGGGITIAMLTSLLPVIAGVGLAIFGITSLVNMYKEANEEVGESLDAVTEKQKKLREELINSSNAIKKAKSDEVKSILDSISALEKERNTAQLTSDATATLSEQVRAVTKANDDYEARLKPLISKLQEMGFTLEEAKTFVADVKVELANASDGLLQFKDSLGQANSLLVDASDKHELLADAIYEMETAGFLADNTLNKLIETYPEIVKETGLAKDSFIAYANALMSGEKDLVDSAIIRLEKDITLSEERIKLYNAEIDKLKEIAKTSSSMGIGYALDSLIGKDTETKELVAIEDARNAIARLKNELKQMDSTEVGLSNRLKEFNKQSEKSVTILTEQEKAVRDLNQQIALKEKLLARTEGEENQIAINKELVELNKQLKVALLEQRTAFIESNKSLKDGTPEYDKYIDNLYKMALGIEDVTNEIISLEIANNKLNKSMMEAQKQSVNEVLQEAIKGVNSEIERQIENLNELQQASDDYYDNLIANKQAEIDAFELANELVDEQIRLQEALQAVEDARERKRNILANRNVRLVQNADVGFEWVADPREIAKVNEELVSAEKNVVKVREDIARNERIRNLEAEKVALEQAKQMKSDAYDAEINLLEKYQSDVALLMEDGDRVSKDGLRNLMAELEAIQGNSFKARLSGVNDFVNQYNVALASMRSIDASLSQMNSFSPTPVSSQTSNVTTKPSSDTKLVTPTATNVSKNINTNNANKSTNIGTVNVTSPAKSVDALLKDVNSKAKVYDPRVTLY